MDESESRPAVTTKRSRAARTALRLTVAGLILILVLALIGIAYTFFVGSKPAYVAPAPAVAKPQGKLPGARPVVAADATVGASVQTITSPVAQGDNSYIAIKTLQTAVCTIAVEYNKAKATDSGLVGKTADEYGVVSWSWTVPAGTPTGSWPVTVTCVHGQKSAVVAATLVVVKPAAP